MSSFYLCISDYRNYRLSLGIGIGILTMESVVLFGRRLRCIFPAPCVGRPGRRMAEKCAVGALCLLSLNIAQSILGGKNPDRGGRRPRIPLLRGRRGRHSVILGPLGAGGRGLVNARAVNWGK